MPRKTAKPEQTWPRIRPTTDRKGRVKYMVDTRLAGTDGGRLFFNTKVEAQTVAEQARIKRRNEGDSAFQISASDRMDAESALRLLRSHGITLKQAADFSLRHLSTILNPKPIKEVVDEALAMLKQDGTTNDHLSSLRSTWNRFATAHPTKRISEIKAFEADHWLRTLPGISGGTRNEYGERLSTLYLFAVKRRYAVDNPFKGLEKARVTRSMPKILSISEVISLLRAADAIFMPCLLLGVFAGLRPISEVCRLQWERIDFERKRIYVAPGCTKNQKSVRFVDMSDNLIQWLLPFRKYGGLVVESRGVYRRALLRACRKAGYGKDALAALNYKGEKPQHGQWTKDVLRHTFCSMYLATHSLDDLIKQMGHTDDDMIFKHYRAVVRPEEAAIFWELRPKSLDAKTIKPGLRLPELVDEYLAAIAPERFPGDSYDPAVVSYFQATSACRRFCETTPTLIVADVQPEHVQSWLDGLRKRRSTIVGYKGELSRMFRYAVEHGYARSNPAVDSQPGPRLEVAELAESNIVPMVA